VHLGVPGYLGIPRNFARLDYVLHAHEVDAGGIRLGNTSLGPRDVLYLMPEHHFPQCVTLDDARREAILEHSVRRDVVVVEDYYDSEFYYDHQLRMALKGSSAGRKVVYLGIFSKIPFNTVRLGYVIAEADLIQEMASLHWSLSRGTNGFSSAMGCRVA
jgi:GntR family transcriptional regulator/MocR family aminotransferase